MCHSLLDGNGPGRTSSFIRTIFGTRLASSVWARWVISCLMPFLFPFEFWILICGIFYFSNKRSEPAPSTDSSRGLSVPDLYHCLVTYHLDLDRPTIQHSTTPYLTLPYPTYSRHPMYIQHSLQLQPRRYPSISPAREYSTADNSTNDLYDLGNITPHTQAGPGKQRHNLTKKEPTSQLAKNP